MNIYQKVKKEKRFIISLAPMEDVTDVVFRQIITSISSPDLVYTEFTNVEGLGSEGVLKVIHRLKQNNTSKTPVIAQIWGITPEDYYKACLVIKELGFDGVDINMGCPVKKVIKQGACSALIKNKPLAKKIIDSCKKALNGSIPLSIKTRIGFDKIETDDWIKFILKELKPDALTVHGRTVKEESSVPNHWEEIEKIYEIKRNIEINSKLEIKNLKTKQKAGLIADIIF